MRVFGVVAECNPFHAGHAQLVKSARENGADALVAVMSGSFVQRGEPAILSKFERAAEMADAGFDLVIELPARYSLSSAERFAAAGVSVLGGIGVVDSLYFGSECGDIDLLTEAAKAAADERVFDKTKALQNEGLSYPAARQQAVSEFFGGKIAAALNDPNNILAVEYLKARDSLFPALGAMTVRRSPDAPSAHGIREDAAAGLPLGERVSQNTAALLKTEAVDYDVWQKVALLKLRQLSVDDLCRVTDCSGGLAQRIAYAASVATSLDELYAIANTKRYTLSRVKRACCLAALGLFDDAPKSVPYARILAIGKQGKQLLSLMKAESRLPFSHSLAVLADSGEDAKRTAAEEIRTTDLYNFLKAKPLPLGEDLTRRLYVVK